MNELDKILKCNDVYAKEGQNHVIVITMLWVWELVNEGKGIWRKLGIIAIHVYSILIWNWLTVRLIAVCLILVRFDFFIFQCLAWWFSARVRLPVCLTSETLEVPNAASKHCLHLGLESTCTGCSGIADYAPSFSFCSDNQTKVCEMLCNTAV